MTDIDYERMKAVWPGQKRALAEAMKIEDKQERIDAVKAVIVSVVIEWNEIGAWPDDWAHFERALSDAQGWPAPYDIAAVMQEHRTRERKAREDRVAAEKAAFAERFPEHTKLEALGGDNQTVGQFLEWLSEHGYEISEWDEESERYVPLLRPPQSWIAHYFQIDPAKIELEKRAMLTDLRSAQGLDAEGVPV